VSFGVVGFQSNTQGIQSESLVGITCLSFLTCVLSLILFGISGGSFHRDGGPIAFSFLLLWAIGLVVLPVSFLGFVVVAISRKRDGVPILDK
jgi:apolipoprotein N-acyltransferase